MKLFSLLFFFLISVCLLSQNEQSKWYFGNKATLDFMSSPPTIIGNSAMNTLEGSASIADGNGNLLFYTNGVEIWNKNNLQMANANSLTGNASTTQSSLILKKPGSTNLYYVFTQGAGNTPAVLAYSIVDMVLATGLGSVTVKNDTLSKLMTEKLAATPHCNGTDIWIVSHKYNTDQFFAFLLTAAGINTVPVISASGSIHGPGTPSNSLSSAGQMKISPNGKKIGLAVYAQAGFFELADFDPATGSVSNPVMLGSYFIAYGCEFSPDGTKLYGSYYIPAVTPTGNIVQWDLCAGSAQSVISSQTTVVTTTLGMLGSMQLGPDGKLYVAMNSASTIATINAPDNYGSACNPVLSSISLGSGVNCVLGLPNIMGSTFREKASLAASSPSCGTTSFSFTPHCVGPSVNSLHWNFGDPTSGNTNTSTLNNPSHTYAANGTYTAQLTLNYDCYTDVIQSVITITDYPVLSISGNTTICKDEITTLHATGANTYSWSTGTTSSSAAFSPSATVIYTLTGSNAQCSSVKIITVSILSCTGLNNQSEGNICVVLYPNPASEKAVIESAIEGYAQFYDQMGRVVLSGKILHGINEIDITFLNKGLYSVKVLCGKDLIIIRFIKE